MKKTFLKITGIVFFISSILTYLIVLAHGNSKSHYYEIPNYLDLEKTRVAIENLNSKLPKEVDNNITLIEMTYLDKSNIILSSFVISNVSKNEIQAKILDYQDKEKKSISDKNYSLHFKAIFLYVFYASDGKELGSFMILPNEYL